MSKSNPVEVLWLKRQLNMRQWDVPRMPVKAVINGTQTEFDVVSIGGSGGDALVLYLEPVDTQHESGHGM